MARETLHRFESDGKRFAIDPETCFCFECDAISWDVLEFYPRDPVNHIYRLLEGKYPRAELSEVIGELEWLRATRSILQAPQKENLLKSFEVERGLKRLTLTLPRETSEPAAAVARKRWFGARGAVALISAPEMARSAAALLLSRSETQKDLRIEFVEDRTPAYPEQLAELCAQTLKAARLAGKNLTAAVHVANVPVAKPPESLLGHALGITIEFQEASAVLEPLRALAAAGECSLARLAKLIHAAPRATGLAVLRPGHGAFRKAVEDLDAAGFSQIQLDIEGAYAANPALEPNAMLAGISETARYYAQRLLEHHYFRLDPIASLFWRIYNGTPLRRADPAGTNELAVDAKGAIYPCRDLAGVEGFCLGYLAQGTFDEERASRFEDMGALTTPECLVCWARCLCGGGAAAVHHALSGNFRKPHATWCDAQRQWMEAAVAAFQTLSSRGVHFERVYKTLGRREKPSLFALAKAVLTMSIGVRPIEEADAELLTRWENWNEASYFTFNETGTLLATKYDREMDSLHPKGFEHELVLIRKTGEPLGLLKVRPDRLPGVAQAWLYMHDEADYASETVRKGFRAILKEASGQHALRRLVTAAGPHEPGLQAFLKAVGFTGEGVLREALYLHGGYRDMTVFTASSERL